MNMITPHHNYDNGWIGLVNIQLDGVPEIITVNGLSLQRKTEFHITMIYARGIAKLIDEANSRTIELEIANAFIAYVRSHRLDDFILSHDFRFVQDGERKTVIVMVNVPELDGFFAQLSQHYGKQVPVQPAHITLYTLQPDAGIGVGSPEELAAKTSSVQIPELIGIRWI